MSTRHVVARAAAAALGLALVFAAPAAEAEEPRFRLVLNGAFGVGSLDFSESRSFTQNVEQSRFDASYQAKSGPGFDFGIEYRFAKHVAVLASFTRVQRDQSASFSAGIPHPFFFDRDRSVEGRLDSLDYTEQAGHLSLAYRGGSGKLDFTLFAGGSYFDVEGDLIERVDVDETYPFDEVTLRGTPVRTFSDSPFGFHVGAGLDVKLSKSVAVGAQLRFSRATARFNPVPDQEVELDAGGVQAAAGVRLYF